MLKRKSNISIFVIVAMMLSLIMPKSVLAVDPIIIGTPEDASLTIYKYSQEPDGSDENIPGIDPAVKGTPLQGVTYKLKQTHSFNAIEDTWSEITDGIVLEGITDTDGKIIFNKNSNPPLALGRYEVQEIDAPEGVIVNDEVFSVDVPMTNLDRTTLNYNVEIYPKNEVVRADGTLVKRGENGELLEGVVFNLFKDTEQEIKYIDQLTTNSKGEIQLQNLPAGKYFLQESKTIGKYSLNTTRINFEVKKEKIEGTYKSVFRWIEGNINDINGNITNYKKPSISKDANGENKLPINREEVYKYNLKITTPGDINNYKALGVSDTLDKRLEFVTSESETPNGWTVTGVEKSAITFKKDGQKLIWEIDPSKLKPNQEIIITFTAKIKADAVLGETEEGIENTADLHFNNGKGSYTDPINPGDPNYDPYEPQDPDKPVDPTNPDNPNPPVPEPQNPINPVNPPIVIPLEGGIKITKVDKQNSSLKLKGAEFKITDINGNIIVAPAGVIKVNGKEFTGNLENLVTGDGTEGTILGEIEITGLTPGIYQLHETKAPTYEDENGVIKPYRLLSKPLEFEVKPTSGNTLSDLIVKNSKSGWNLPTTGGIGTILFTISGLSLMFASVILLRKEKKVYSKK